MLQFSLGETAGLYDPDLGVGRIECCVIHDESTIILRSVPFKFDALASSEQAGNITGANRTILGFHDGINVILSSSYHLSSIGRT